MACTQPDDLAAGDFKYREFFECSDTWQRTRVRNIPQREETYAAIGELCEKVLLPIQVAFSRPVLTMGFCSDELRRSIFSGISPSRDQHAGYERNNRGEQICKRGGFASDFYISGTESSEIARWVIQNTPFDRLYYYGSDRPIHVSVNDPPIAQIVTMTNKSRNGHRVPSVVSKELFLRLTND